MSETGAARIKLLLADESGTLEPPPVNTLDRAATAATRNPRRTVLMAAAVAASVAALAVGLTLGRGGDNHAVTPPQSYRSPTASSSSSSSTLLSHYPVVPGRVALYLDLPRESAPADAHPVPSLVHLVNGLGHSFVVPSACNGWLKVGLIVNGHPPQMSDGFVACSGRTIPVGSTVIAVDISTTYDGCSQQRSTGSVAFCEGPGHNQSPRFPAGRYHVTSLTSGVPSPITPRHQTLTLTP